MKLEKDGKVSKGQRRKHFNIKLFYVTNLIRRKEMEVDYCSTDNMLADFFTKPLLQEKFQLLRNKIMNED